MTETTKSASFYKGKITIDFYEAKHQYIVRETGERPISVTAVTGIIDKSRPLIIWATRLAGNHILEKLKNGIVITEAIIQEAINQHQVVKKEAASIGSQVHDWAEQYIGAKAKNRKELEMPKDEKVLNGVIAFLKWVEEHKIKFLDSEKLVYSKKHGYVGIMDCKFTMGDEKHKIIHCGDFKTSKAIYNEYRYQVAAYQEADTEESKEIYGTKWLMRFDKETGEFEAHEFGEHKKDFEAFLGALAVKRREKELSKF